MSNLTLELLEADLHDDAPRVDDPRHRRSRSRLSWLLVGVAKELVETVDSVRVHYESESVPLFVSKLFEWLVVLKNEELELFSKVL